MNSDQVARYITQRLNEIGRSYPNRATRHAYEQGILIGLLSALAEHDSKNFDILKKQLDKLSAKDSTPKS